MKILKRLTVVIAVLAILFSMPITAFANNNIPYSTYAYNYDGEPVESPHAYTPSVVFKGSDINISDFSSPADMCLDNQNNIYIADTENARVVAISSDFSNARIISNFNFNGKDYSFVRPTGLYITDDGELFVADSTGINIYVFSKELECIRIIEQPKSNLLPDDFSYIPVKISVDKAGRIYIISEGNTYGVVALDKNGEFSTFIGAQKVGVSVIDKLWRKFMTAEQKKRTLSYVPTNYNNINIDEKGFLYVTATYSNINAVVQAIQSRSTDNRYAMIKKLNSSGEDVLLRNGAFPPCGDVEITLSTDGNSTNTDILYGPSSITDVAVGFDGVYSLADQKRGKIFSYDRNGNLLYAFGGTGYQEGLFRKLSAIDYSSDNRIYALDSNAGSITVFAPTGYGELVQKAINLTANRKYEESVGVYEQLLLENTNFDLANIGIGTAKMRQGKFEEAMYYYKLANDVDNYSEAYSEYRREKLSDYILIIPIAVVIICIAISYFFKFIKNYNSKTPVARTEKRSFMQEFGYAFHVIFHPFDGFWELKRSKRGSARAATVILALATVSMLFRGIGLGYIYTGKPENDFNLGVNLIVIIGVVAIWCISNWCLTSLMYGEGGLKDIYIASCYSLLPLVFFTIPATVLSNYITQNELMFVNFLFTIGYLWVGLLLFVAVLSTHDYQLGTNVITVTLTIVGMIIIVFLMLLFVNLIGQMFSMFANIYKEITFRL